MISIGTCYSGRHELQPETSTCNFFMRSGVAEVLCAATVIAAVLAARIRSDERSSSQAHSFLAVFISSEERAGRASVYYYAAVSECNCNLESLESRYLLLI